MEKATNGHGDASQRETFILGPDSPNGREKSDSYLKSHLKEFCENTTLQGFRYLTEPHLRWIERFLWIVAILGFFVGSVFFILELVEEYRNKPVITTVHNTMFPVYKTEYPAITICNFNKLSLDKWLFKNNVNNTSPTVEDMEVFHRHTINKAVWNKEIEMEMENNSHLVAEQLKYAGQTCQEMLLQCLFRNKDMCITELVPTDDGFCCSITAPENTDPHAGRANGFHLLLDTDTSTYFSSESGVGFQVLIHNKRSFPHVWSQGIALQPGTEAFVSIRPEVTYSTEDALALHPSKRNCYSEGEKQLTYFQKYTLSNCWQDYVVKKLIEKCDCRDYYMPDINPITNETVAYCVSRNRLCMFEFWEKLGTYVDSEEIEENCLMECNTTKFDVQLSSSRLVDIDFYTVVDTITELLDVEHPITEIIELIKQKVERQREGCADLGGLQELKSYCKNDTSSPIERVYEYARYNLVELNVFHADVHTVRLKRDTRYSISEFVANIGGLLGLWLGFSLMSLTELFYFFILKPLASIGKNKRGNL